MRQVVAYVDGMNLYHGLHHKYGRQYLWLDLHLLASRLRIPDEIIKIRYYTTIVKGEPEAARRQENYLAGLTSLHRNVEVIRGNFKLKKFRCPQCSSRWTCLCEPTKEFSTYEEKLTDVAIGVSMVKDAAINYGNASLLITADTDLNPAVIACAELAPERPIYIALPPGRGSSRQLSFSNVIKFHITEEHLKASLLPSEIPGKNNQIYRKPDKWQN